jgi:hypothetical protein
MMSSLSGKRDQETPTLLLYVNHLRHGLIGHDRIEAMCMVSWNVALSQPMELADILAVGMGESIFCHVFSLYLGFPKVEAHLQPTRDGYQRNDRIAQVEVHLRTINLIFPLLFTPIDF